jgi:hypothetical protein
MTDEIDFEDRVVLAVTDALVGTLAYWVRAVAVRVDESDGFVEVFFAGAEDPVGETVTAIGEFSSRLHDSSSTWLRHTTHLWLGYGFDEWPGRVHRRVFATRVPADGMGMTPAAEFKNAAAVTIAATMSHAFGPELWAATFSSDASTRTVDLHLGFSRDLTGQDRFGLEGLLDVLDGQDPSTLWRPHVWIGDIRDAADWPGVGLTPIYLQRSPDSPFPDDYEPEEPDEVG